MSIDSSEAYVWVPAGSRSTKGKGEVGHPWTAYNCFEEMPDDQRSPHQVFLAHDEHLIDEEYFFEDPDDARWFWIEGYKAYLFRRPDGKPIGYDHMTLWIAGEEIDSRVQEPKEMSSLQSSEDSTAIRPDGVHGEADGRTCRSKSTTRTVH